jgi:hypothetical protein
MRRDMRGNSRIAPLRARLILIGLRLSNPSAAEHLAAEIPALVAANRSLWFADAAIKAQVNNPRDVTRASGHIPRSGGRSSMSEISLGRGLVVVICALLAACGSLPDARPFADATGAWSASVKASGQAISDSLREASAAVPEPEREQYEKIVKEFEDAWIARIRAAQAAAAYSNAIADLVASAAGAGESVTKVGDSLTALASASGISLGAPLVDVAGDVARFLADRIAIVRAQRSLGDAVAQAQPAVDRIAEHLVSESNRQLKPMLERTHKNALSGIKQQYDAESGFALQLEKRLVRAREEALKEPGKAAALMEADRMLGTVAAKLKERDQKLEQAAASYRARLQLINALSTSTAAWAAAHRDLGSAIREKRRANAAELQETVSDLRELVKKVRAL